MSSLIVGKACFLRSLCTYMWARIILLWHSASEGAQLEARLREKHKKYMRIRKVYYSCELRGIITVVKSKNYSKTMHGYY